MIKIECDYRTCFVHLCRRTERRHGTVRYGSVGAGRGPGKNFATRREGGGGGGGGSKKVFRLVSKSSFI